MILDHGCRDVLSTIGHKMAPHESHSPDLEFT